MSVFQRKDRKKNKWIFQYSYKTADGKTKYKSESFATKKDAKAAEAKYIDQHHGKQKFDPTISFYDFYTMYVNTFKSKSVSANTLIKYNDSGAVIKKYFKETKLVNITRTSYQQFINWYIDDEHGSKHAKETVQKVHIHAHQAIRLAAEEGFIPEDIAFKATLGGEKGKPESAKFLEADQFEQLRDYVNANVNLNRTALLMCQFAIYTGARLGEIGGMTWDDVDEDNNTISISKTFRYATFKPEHDDNGNVIWPDAKHIEEKHNEVFGPTKTESSVRVVDVSPVLIASLHKLIQARKIKAKTNPYHLLFTGQDGLPPTSNGVNKSLRAAMTKCKINNPKFSFHGLRHSHGSYLLDKDVDLKYVSKRLGHENIGITIKTYTHVLDRLKKEEAVKAVQVL